MIQYYILNGILQGIVGYIPKILRRNTMQNYNEIYWLRMLMKLIVVVIIIVINYPNQFIVNKSIKTVFPTHIIELIGYSQYIFDR